MHPCSHAQMLPSTLAPRPLQSEQALEHAGAILDFVRSKMA
jgi:hypothetical protein